MRISDWSSDVCSSDLAEWFTSHPEVPESLTITVFKVPGETNTDDLSPAPDATTRPDIPMHALAMLQNKRDGAEFDPAEDGKRERKSEVYGKSVTVRVDLGGRRKIKTKIMPYI